MDRFKIFLPKNHRKQSNIGGSIQEALNYKTFNIDAEIYFTRPTSTPAREICHVITVRGANRAVEVYVRAYNQITGKYTLARQRTLPSRGLEDKSAGYIDLTATAGALGAVKRKMLKSNHAIDSGVVAWSNYMVEAIESELSRMISSKREVSSLKELTSQKLTCIQVL